ncbi:MAG: hypothetical protein ABSC48_01925 [Terracidiphilus sp.]
MEHFTVLASGSKGNTAVVSGRRTRILVDCGMSCDRTTTVRQAVKWR